MVPAAETALGAKMRASEATDDKKSNSTGSNDRVRDMWDIAFAYRSSVFERAISMICMLSVNFVSLSGWVEIG